MTGAPATGALRMHIGGQWVAAASGAELESVDPTTEQVLGAFPDGGAEDVEAAVAAAREAAPAWRDLGRKRRAGLLRELSARVAEREPYGVVGGIAGLQELLLSYTREKSVTVTLL